MQVCSAGPTKIQLKYKRSRLELKGTLIQLNILVPYHHYVYWIPGAALVVNIWLVFKKFGPFRAPSLPPESP